MGYNLAMDDALNSLITFEKHNIRRVYSEDDQKWYFSIVDIVAVLIDQSNYKRAQSYWTTLKSRLKKEGSEFVTNCDELKSV